MCKQQSIVAADSRRSGGVVSMMEMTTGRFEPSFNSNRRADSTARLEAHFIEDNRLALDGLVEFPTG